MVHEFSMTPKGSFILPQNIKVKIQEDMLTQLTGGWGRRGEVYFIPSSSVSVLDKEKDKIMRIDLRLDILCPRLY